MAINDIPKMLNNPDLSRLKGTLQTFITNVVEGNRIKDIDYYITESALETFFGSDIFDWLNENYYDKE